jgi:ornithine cyclodeaminase
VISVGANPAGKGEVAAAIVRDAAVVAVEYRDSTLAPPPAGASELQDLSRDVVELGELVAGTKAGRGSRDEITLYKSVGVAVQDAAAAALVLAAAKERSVGREIELEESE